MSKFARPGAKAPASPAPKTPAKPASKYKRAGETQLGADANYLRAGSYLLLVTKIEEGMTPRGKEDFVSVHLTTLAADDSERTDLDRRFGGATHRVGEETNWFQKLSGDYFDSNMLKFAIVAYNQTQEEIAALEEEHNTTIIADMVGEDQPLAGVVLEAQVQVKIKKAGRELPEEKLTGDHVSTITTWRRRVPFAEVKEMVDADVLAKFLPDLDKKIAQEAQA